MLDQFSEVRCPNCSRLVFKYKLTGCLTVEAKCSRCNKPFTQHIVRSQGTTQE